MKNKLALIIFIEIALILTLMIILIDQNASINRHANAKVNVNVAKQTKHGKEFTGIKILDQAKLLQDQMKEDDLGNTQGTITYMLEDNNKTLDMLVADVIKQSNSALWDIKEIKNEKTPDSKYINFIAKDKAVKSTTAMAITSNKDSKKVFIILSSYFENGK